MQKAIRLEISCRYRAKVRGSADENRLWVSDVDYQVTLVQIQHPQAPVYRQHVGQVEGSNFTDLIQRQPEGDQVAVSLQTHREG